MKNIKHTLVALACTLCMANVVSAAEQQPVDSVITNDQKVENKVEQETIMPVQVRNVLSTRGTITAVDSNRITVRGEGEFSEVTVLIDDNTYIVDGKKGKIKQLKNLKVGKKVTVYYSSKMTRSIPPQAEAFAVVLGDNEAKQGKYFKVSKVINVADENYIKVVNSNQDIVATISKDVYNDYQKIKEGDCLILWYDIMTMSIPGQTNAKKVVVLPEISK